ncbi:tripartite tricarboxylate transporter substrate binding protein [Bordetella sp. N]|uniref:Bug family tripartite tricarboxylate transporter substrate binding protein n=1 Tax=Bordetella sp. N TaxID=1746199 RepID=UPI000710C241|nr:tripartite tricarboxylate transporter substrate binding protein [Bordetella sp. N]ALM83481.1 twin-arginine translocation pathway signal protein [Bordetella sp. N]
MKRLRRTLCATALAAALPISLVHAADASFPEKPIYLIYPYAPGSASDTLARLTAEVLQKQLGQTVIVDGKPGAGGSIGLEYVTRAKPDGYTIVLTATGTVAVNPQLYKLRYNPVKDLTQLTILAEVPFVFVVNNDFPAKDLKSFIALAKQKPGAITSGNAGTGTHANLTQVSFEKAAGIDLNLISYKGGSLAVTDLIGGHLDSMIDNTASQTPYITSGKVTPLFVTSDYHIANYPQVPTAKELGLPDFARTGWFGLAAPAGTPAPVIARFQDALQKGMKDPAVSKRLTEIGFVPVISDAPTAQQRAQEDYEKLGKIAQDMHIKPE